MNIFFFKPNSFDLVISTQLIEHLHDDFTFISGIRSILKPNSYLYLTSIIKGKHAWWIYRKNDMIVLDPTHIHEYRSKEEFENLLATSGFSTEIIKIIPVRYGLLEIIIRGLNYMGIHIKNVENIFVDYPILTKINKIKIPVPGYSIIEGIFRVKEE